MNTCMKSGKGKSNLISEITPKKLQRTLEVFHETPGFRSVPKTVAPLSWRLCIINTPVIYPTLDFREPRQASETCNLRVT